MVNDILIVACFMGQSAIGAIFDPCFGEGIIPTAILLRIERTIAKQAIKILGFRHLMAGKFIALAISEKCKTVLHNLSFFLKN